MVEKAHQTESLEEAKLETIALKEDPIWKSLPKDIKPKVLTLVKQFAFKQTIVSGPLPASEELAKYEQIAPGGSESAYYISGKSIQSSNKH